MLVPLWTTTRVRRFPFVVLATVVAQVSVHVFVSGELDDVPQRWGCRPPQTLHDTYWFFHYWRRAITLVTYTFIHGSWLHLAANGIVLVVFGSPLESRLGSRWFACLYALFGAIAALVHGMMIPDSTAVLIGASGAISGLLAMYVALDPLSHILSLFVVVVCEVPTLLYMAIWLFLQWDGVQLHLLQSTSYAQVAWWAHLGGASIGLVGGILWRRAYPDRDERATD